MNSFIGIFQGFYLDFKNAVLSPHAFPMYWLKPNIKLWRAQTPPPPPHPQWKMFSLPMFSTSVGNPGLKIEPTSYFLHHCIHCNNIHTTTWNELKSLGDNIVKIFDTTLTNFTLWLTMQYNTKYHHFKYSNQA